MDIGEEVLLGRASVDMIVVIPEETSELMVKPLENFGLAVSGDVGGR